METKISPYQFFAAMVLFSFGSSVLFFLTPDAKQDAWLVLLFYIPVGMIEQLMYIKLFYQYPNDTPVTYMPKIFGIYIGSVVSILYIIYFTYQAGRIIRDFTELILISSMPDMLPFIIAITLTVIFVYGAFSGVENISRAAELILPLWIVIFIVLFLSLYASPDVVKFQNLKPFLEKDIPSLIKDGWLLVTFPYGETIIFTMFYSSVNQPAKVRKTSLLVVLFFGIFLSLNTIMFIVSLGIIGATSTLFPFFASTRLIQLGFLSKLDIFVIITMIIGGFFKVSLLTYAAMLGTSQLIKLKDPKYLAIPFGIAIVIISILIAKSYPEHIIIGLKVNPLRINFPIQIIVPFIALIVYYLRKLMKNPKKKNTHSCKNK
ncbi:MAG: spore germination protein [Bacillota bacterium]|jgi:spore germination protein KB|nr:spore germination protein [Bacillota bacterium]